MESTRTNDRRIGHRSLQPPIRIGWRVEDPAKKRRRRRDSDQTGWILELSVTGALVEAPRADDLYVGHRIRIRLGEHTGTVVIRRAVPSSVEDMARYGVEFQALEPEMADALRAQLESERPAGLEDYWRNAT